MAETKKSEPCCGDQNILASTTSASGTECCSSSREALDSEGGSACCSPQSNSTSTGDARADKRCLKIDFLYLDLSVCERCRDTDSALEDAIGEVARILETTGVDVALNKIHVTSEAQAVVLGFVVSPTIRVNDRDIQMNFRESPCESCGSLCECEGGVSCREWEYQGQWHMAPPKGLIIDAILKEVYGGAGGGREDPQKRGEAPDNLKRFFSSLPHQEATGRS